MVHKKKNKKTNNGPQEKEQKDKQWSTRKRTKRQTMVYKKKSKKSFCSFSCGPLFVFLFFFLWTIVCHFALFLVDHCLLNNGPQEKEQKDKQWSTRKRTKRKTMVHKKKNKKKNNGPQEKEQKDKQWSTIKRAKRQTMVRLFVLFLVAIIFSVHRLMVVGFRTTCAIRDYYY
jgi:uncharacterized membrane protein